jgi:hypothetical protein
MAFSLFFGFNDNAKLNDKVREMITFERIFLNWQLTKVSAKAS